MKRELYQYYIIDRAHHTNRVECREPLAASYAALGLHARERMTRRFEFLCRAETPHMHPSEQIVLVRTVKQQPDIFTAEE